MNVKCYGPNTVSHRLMLLQAGPSVCTEKCFAYSTAIKQVGGKKLESPRVWVNEPLQVCRDVLTTQIIQPMMNTSCSRLINSSGPWSLLAEHNQYHISFLSSSPVQEVTFFFISLRGRSSMWWRWSLFSVCFVCVCRAQAARRGLHYTGGQS